LVFLSLLCSGPATVQAPGAIVPIFGLNLASGTTTAATTLLRSTLGGVTRDAPLFLVSPLQVDAQMPFELVGNPVPVRVGTVPVRTPALHKNQGRERQGSVLNRIADRVATYTIDNAESLQRNRNPLVIMGLNPLAVEPYTGNTPIRDSAKVGGSMPPTRIHGLSA
jgi:hypothetical protein